jgi:hypothetical protein
MLFASFVEIGADSSTGWEARLCSGSDQDDG